MKKSISIIAMLCLFLVNTEAKKIEGIIITANQDTMEVTLRISTSFFTGDINHVALQRKIKYIDENGKKRKIRANEAKEVRFTYQGDDIRLLSMPMSDVYTGLFNSSNKVFLHLKLDGPLRLFTYYSKTNNASSYNNNTGMWNGSGGTSVREVPLLQKGNDKVKKPNYFKFRKDMMSYLSDCPTLVAKLENKDFRRRDVYDMVWYYNSNCK